MPDITECVGNPEPDTLESQECGRCLRWSEQTEAALHYRAAHGKPSAQHRPGARVASRACVYAEHFAGFQHIQLRACVCAEHFGGCRFPCVKCSPGSVSSPFMLHTAHVASSQCDSTAECATP